MDTTEVYEHVDTLGLQIERWRICRCLKFDEIRVSVETIGWTEREDTLGLQIEQLLEEIWRNNRRC